VADFLAEDDRLSSVVFAAFDSDMQSALDGALNERRGG
jgi:hypothetical protein